MGSSSDNSSHLILFSHLETYHIMAARRASRRTSRRRVSRRRRTTRKRVSRRRRASKRRTVSRRRRVSKRRSASKKRRVARRKKRVSIRGSKGQVWRYHNHHFHEVFWHQMKRFTCGLIFENICTHQQQIENLKDMNVIRHCFCLENDQETYRNMMTFENLYKKRKKYKRWLYVFSHFWQWKQTKYTENKSTIENVANFRSRFFLDQGIQKSIKRALVTAEMIWNNPTKQNCTVRKKNGMQQQSKQHVAFCVRGTKEKTKSSGYTKKDLMMNKRGKVVSKKAHSAGVRRYKNNGLSKWTTACMKARKSLGIVGFKAVKKGTAYYKEARKIYDSMK